VVFNINENQKCVFYFARSSNFRKQPERITLNDYQNLLIVILCAILGSKISAGATCYFSSRLRAADIRGPLQRVLNQRKKHILRFRFMARFLKLPLEYQLQVWREGVKLFALTFLKILSQFSVIDW
jgi:hypothetical protein